MVAANTESNDNEKHQSDHPAGDNVVGAGGGERKGRRLPLLMRTTMFFHFIHALMVSTIKDTESSASL